MRHEDVTFNQVVGLLLLGWALWWAGATWREALTVPATIASAPLSVASTHDQAWYVGGTLREAHHITTSAPDYRGEISVAGWDEHNTLLWSIAGVKTIERKR